MNPWSSSWLSACTRRRAAFKVADLALHQEPLILYLPGIFAGFLYILTIKFRKSPFDLSMSHHAHQEIVRGITTEFSGPSLAIIEMTHWYENVLLLGMVYLFFGFNPWIALAVALGTYMFEIFIDMNYARFKWQLTFGSSWAVHGGRRSFQYYRSQHGEMT